MTQPTPPPSSEQTNKAHANSDVDSAVTAQHHRLGTGHNQASPGDHKHDGHTSKLVGKGKDLAFPVTANAVYVQADFQKVINALRVLGWGV